jgi:NAD(P)H dehydrogenase (quinone)
MKNAKILVTAAAGRTGSHVVEQLIQQGYQVRAMVRKLDAKSERLTSLGAEVVVGDFLNVKSLRTAMNGIKRAYFCYPPSDHLLEATTNFAIVAKEKTFESVVNMSQIIVRENHPSALSRQHWLSEQVLDWADVGATHIRPTFFAEMAAILSAESIARDGKLYLPHGDKKHAPVTTDDIAAVVVGVLKNPEPHIGKAYTVTGQQVLSQADIAEIIGDVIGKPVEYVDIPMEYWQQAIAEKGHPKFLIDHLSRVGEDYQNGLFDKVTDVVFKVGGKKPKSFDKYVQENISVFNNQIAKALP